MKRIVVMLVAIVLGFAAGADEKPMLIVNIDNNHYQHQFSDNEQTVPAIEKYVDEYLGGAATHIFINPQAMRAFYDSKALEPIWRAYDEPGAATDVGWLRRSKLLHDRGIDLYAVMLNRIRRRGGVEGWISMRMNDVHGVDNPRSCLVSVWWLRRPDLWRVPFDSTRQWSNRAFDYSHREVRDHHVAAAKELLERYDMDGFEVDWTRFPWHLTPGKEKSQSGFLTEVMREIRKAANATAKLRGHPVKVAASVLSSPETALGSGTDAVTWAKEGLIDVLLVANFFPSVDFETPWREWCDMIHAVNPKVRIVPRIDDGVMKTPYKRLFLGEAEYNAYFERLLAQGCRDFGFFNVFVKKNTPSWKWNLAVAQGVVPERVRAARRVYPSSFRDAGPGGYKNGWQFPFDMTAARDVTIEIGLAADARRVFINAAYDTEIKELPTLTLNGVSPLAVDSEWNGHWDSKPGQIKRYGRYEFPASALKDGVNAIGFPVCAGGRACGCEMEVLPRLDFHMNNNIKGE